MSKSLFKNFTDEEFKTLEWILRHPNAKPIDLFFNDPTIDGRIQELKKYGLITLDSDDTMNITELGRAAFKEYCSMLKLEEIYQQQREQELSSFKAIADASDYLSRSAKEIAVNAQNLASNSLLTAESSKKLSDIASKKAGEADVKSWIAIAISILAVIVEIISNWDSISMFFQSFI